MRSKGNPATVRLTGGGAKTRKTVANYSQVAFPRQARIDHRGGSPRRATPVVTGGGARSQKPAVAGISRSNSSSRCDINVAPEPYTMAEKSTAVGICQCNSRAIPPALAENGTALSICPSRCTFNCATTRQVENDNAVSFWPGAELERLKTALRCRFGAKLISHRLPRLKCPPRWAFAATTKPLAALSHAFLQRLLTSACKAVSLRVLKQERCVDLHHKPGLFLFPTTEFASSVGVSARPPEPFLALGTLDAFLFGGSHHE